jgi:hypothetical protein
MNSTFMIYTKINRDSYDVPFYFRSIDAIAGMHTSPEAPGSRIDMWHLILGVTAYGHELGSHSVAHSPNFGTLAIPPPTVTKAWSTTKAQWDSPPSLFVAGHSVPERFDYIFGNGAEQFEYLGGYSPKIQCTPFPNQT